MQYVLGHHPTRRVSDAAKCTISVTSLVASGTFLIATPSMF